MQRRVRETVDEESPLRSKAAIYIVYIYKEMMLSRSPVGGRRKETPSLNCAGGFANNTANVLAVFDRVNSILTFLRFRIPKFSIVFLSEQISEIGMWFG